MTQQQTIVKKFGGTSVGTIEKIKQCARIVATEYKKNKQVAVVTSAMSGATNKLLSMAYDITDTPNPIEMDALTSSGEQIASTLFAITLNDMGVPATSVQGWQIPIITNSHAMKSRIKHIPTSNSIIHNCIQKQIVPVIAGFQGITEEQRITTLGRGGSDTTAVAIAIALQAQECQIYTDVEGVYTADPRIVPNAKKQDVVEFEEMLEMASLGSKVLQIRSVELAGTYNMPIRVLSTLKPDGKGTLIKRYNQNEDAKMEKLIISGIAHEKDEAQITVVEVQDRPGVAAQILSAISDNNIEVDMIVQNMGYKGTTDFTFTVHRRDYQQAIDTLNQHKEDINFKIVKGDIQIAKVSLVGVGMRSHAGVASTMFSALAKQNINVKTISTSEIKISVLIDEQYLELAIRILHETFKLDQA